MPRRLQIASMILAVLALASGHAHAAGGAIVTYVLQNQPGSIERNVPVTFGAVFADGDVPAGTSIAAVDASGKPVPLQVDAKAHNRDGSLRHAVLTLDVPHLAEGSDFPVSIVHGTPTTGAPVPPSSMPAGFDVVVKLTTIGGRHLTASAHDLLVHTKKTTWLSGPLVTEWWAAGPFRDASGKPDPHLSVRFGVRSYGAGRPLRIEVDVENTWTWVPKPRTEAYDAQILAGGRPVFADAGIVQQAHTRWRKVFWWGKPADVFVKQDLAYLKKTRIIPNYDPRDPTPEFTRLYRNYEKNKRGPMQHGVINPYMPTTGGRDDIGPLPTWTVAYLLTMRKRYSDIMLSAADLSGSFPSHFRNRRTGRPTTTEEFPKISTNYNYVGRPGNLQRPDLRGLPRGLVPDASHQPSLDFIPYAVTGERYYLEELEFWSQWNSWGTAPSYHGFAKGLFHWDQIRGQGWSLRTLAQAAYITPDADPMKATLLRELKANAAWYNRTYSDNPRANVLHVAAVGQPRSTISPWMDDYLTWAAQYAVGLGFDEFKPFARWKGVFPVQRMINPQFCYVMATRYVMVVRKPDGRFLDSWRSAFLSNIPHSYTATHDPRSMKCASEEMAHAFKMQRAGEMVGRSTLPDGYPAQMQPALAAAVDAGVPGAQEAWRKFRNRPMQPADGVAPRWAIVPWSEK